MDETPGLLDGDIILYRTPAGVARVEVLYEGETFWLNQRRIAELFGVELPTISYHLKEIFASGELSEAATVRKIRRVQREGNREVARDIDFYNLDAIISVGYRVNSAQMRTMVGGASREGPISRCLRFSEQRQRPSYLHLRVKVW